MNLDNTDRCPIAEHCGGCGATTELDVATYGTPVGVCCGTLCADCAGAANPDGVIACLSVALGMSLVLDHCGHLGIDLDQMAAAMTAETSV